MLRRALFYLVLLGIVSPGDAKSVRSQPRVIDHKNRMIYTASLGGAVGIISGVAAFADNKDRRALERTSKAFFAAAIGGFLGAAATYLALRECSFESRLQEFSRRYREIARNTVLRDIALDHDLSEWQQEEWLRQELSREFITQWPLVELHNRLLDAQTALEDAQVYVRVLLKSTELASVPSDTHKRLDRVCETIKVLLDRVRTRLKVVCGTNEYAEQVYRKRQHELMRQEIEGGRDDALKMVNFELDDSDF